MNHNNQFDQDERSVTIKNILVILSLLAVSILTCHKVKAQSREVKQILNSIASTSWEYPNRGNLFIEDGQRVGSDTTPVVFVLVKEDYLEEITGDTFHLIPYPTVEAIYGFHVQHWKPYKVEFLDSLWNPINEAELLSIKKRKLFKK